MPIFKKLEKHISKFSNLLTSLILVCILTNCASDKSLSDKKELRDKKQSIALLLPLSGKSKEIGKAALNSAEFGIFKNQNNNISLEVVDTNSPSFNSKDIILECEKQKIKLILGPLFFEESKKLTQEAKNSGITILSFSNNEKIATDNTIMFGLSPENQAESIVSHANDQNNVQEFYLLLPNSLYGELLDKTLQHVIHENNSKAIIHSDFYSSEESMKSIIENFIEKINIDPFKNKALIFPEGGDNLKIFADIINEFEYDSSILHIYGFDKWDEVNLAELEQLDKAYYINKKSNNYKKFEQEFYQNFGYKPPFIAVHVYDAVSLASSLIQQKQALTFTSIVNQENFSGISFNYNFDKNGIVKYQLPLIRINYKKL